MSVQPSDSEIEELMDRPPTPVESEASRQARMDLAIAQERDILNHLAGDLRRLHERLTGEGWRTRISDGEMSIDPPTGGQLLAVYTYVGGEYTVRITRTPERRTNPTIILVRVTPAQYRRQSDCVLQLAEILVLMGQGQDATLHFDSGGTLLGIEAQSYRFGEREPDEIEEEEEVDPAERAAQMRDDGPPDMSGSTPGVER